MDLQARLATGIHNYGAGYAYNPIDEIQGCYYDKLTTNSVSVRRAYTDDVCPEIRIRIWVYN